ncbi:MAG: hypothetical protein OEN55_11415, partial [Alphaproteobacteria bacterium]|nr:hypothetical protein [Alphaproteobacteria bacterium]
MPAVTSAHSDCPAPFLCQAKTGPAKICLIPHRRMLHRRIPHRRIPHRRIPHRRMPYRGAMNARAMSWRFP